MKVQYIVVINGVGDGVGVQFFLENIFGCFVRSFCVFNNFVSGIFFKDGCICEVKELCIGKECFNGIVVVIKL